MLTLDFLCMRPKLFLLHATSYRITKAIPTHRPPFISLTVETKKKTISEKRAGAKMVAVPELPASIKSDLRQLCHPYYLGTII